MVGAVRVISVEQGEDPRRFALMPFGGAGPLHACDVAQLLGMSDVLIADRPGVLSAAGLLQADAQGDFRALIGDTDKDGVWDNGEPILATDTTDSAGCYLFAGLPVDADGEGYLAWVNDTDEVLKGLTQLQILWLDGTQVSEEQVTELRKLRGSTLRIIDNNQLKR